jgi:hypothetical protein
MGQWSFSYLTLSLALLGCAPTSPPSSPTAPAPTKQTVPTVSVADPAQLIAIAPPEREIWTTIYMLDRKVGYSHQAIDKVKENGEELIHTQSDSELTILREKDSLTQRLHLQSWETPAGDVRRFESKMTSGKDEIIAQGTVSERGLVLTTNTLGKKVTKLIPWPEKCGGYFAVDQSLEKKPLKAGESRTVVGLLPIFNQPAEAQLTALEEEEVSLRGLKQKLLKIKNEIKIGKDTLTTFCWIDEQGKMLKSFDPTFKQETYLTTKEFALKKEDLGPIDLLAETTAKLKGELPAERPLKHAVYLAKLKDGQKIDGQFANDEFQQFTAIDDLSGKLTITLLDRSSPVDEKLRGSKPVPEDSAPNSLIQSNDPEVIRLAASIAPNESEPFPLAVALEKGVRQHIHKRGYAQAFATAAEVVRSHEGDCTEHAVLLAAVCRARRIPARVVLGLVYYPPQQGFAYHMWNEVWIGQRWVPLDATVAQGAVGADHIKLRHANLHGESAYAVMLPLLAVVGRLELEVVNSK